MVKHFLTPRFILQAQSHGRDHGHFPATGLFVDVSGFTAAMDVLMRHGQHGAELMANIMRDIFTPLVDFVYEQNGFITGFAGDAFTALFPHTDTDNTVQDPAHRALTAGHNILAHMVANPNHLTPYGSFPFRVKVGIAAGEARWGILKGAKANQHTYYFSGTAVDECAHAEHYANGGDLIVSREIVAQMGPALTAVSLPETTAFLKVTAVHDKTTPVPPQLPAVDNEQARAFMPSALIEELFTGEFRQIISMFISLDQVSTHSELATFMRDVFDLQTQYGGFFNRIDFGDKGCNLLLFWGAPVAHENDVERALNFVLDLRERTPTPIRVGITYYIAHAGYIGAPIREEYTCCSRGVNLSARHMMAADWGEIWLDGETAARAEESFDLAFHDHVPFKGFTEPQPVYLLHGRKDQIMRDTYEGEMIGREPEMAQLATAASPLLIGQLAGAVSVYGEAGMGKSRLVYEFAQRVKQWDTPPLWCFCPTDEILRQSLNPFRYWLRGYFAVSNDLTEAENKAAFDRRLAEIIATTSEPELKNTLERTRSFLGALIDLYWPGSLYEFLEPQLRFENSLEALKALLKAESLRQPVIIELDDAQWLDSDTTQFLRQLTHNVANYPLLVIAASREPLADNLFDTAVAQHTISLNTLAREGIDQFIHMMIRRPPSPALVDFLAARTDGNPFYLEQILLYLAEQNLLDRDTEAQIHNDDSITVPTDVRAVLVARLDRLTRDVRSVVQTASVLGREFETRLLSQMLLGANHIQTQVAEAETAAIWTALNEIRYIFKHGMMRDAAYDMQLRGQLHKLHRLAATALEVVFHDDLEPHYAEIAYHYDRAQDVYMALGYYEKAGDHAKSSYRNAEAIAHYSRALEIAPTDEEALRYEILLGRESVFDWQGKRDEQLQDLETLEALAEQMGQSERYAAVVALRQANYGLVTSNYTAAMIQAERAVSLAQAAQSPDIEAQGNLLMGKVASRQGAFDAAKRALEQSLRLLEMMPRSSQSNGDQSSDRADALMTLGQVYWYQGHYTDAEGYLQQALELNRQLNLRRGEAGCLNALGAMLSEQGDWLAARQYAEEVLNICQEIGYRHGETIILRNLGGDFNDLGDYKTARAYVEQALSTCQELDDRWGEAICHDTLGVIAYGLQEMVEATAFLEEAITIQQEIGDQDGLGYTWTHLGHALLAQGLYAQAKEAYSHSLHIRHELEQKSMAVDTRAGLAHVAVKLGHTAEAAGQLKHVLNWFGEQGADGLEYPLLAYWNCYIVAQQLAYPHTKEILEAAVTLLEERAQRIQDQGLRNQFLHGISAHQALLEAASTS
jgi:predicted ATPase/class 3 adenylate cyclase